MSLGEESAALCFSSNMSHTTFFFVGFPALQRYKRVLALPVGVSFLCVLAGNTALLLVVRATRLSSPMYRLISALCVVDVVVVTAIVPKLLLGLLFDLDSISLVGCLAQMFTAHFLSSLESTLLLAMALDRYVAICWPLSYGRVAAGPAALCLGLLAALRSGSLMGALVALAAALDFRGSAVIRHAYCDHMALVSLACGGSTPSQAAGAAVIGCVAGVDVCLVLLSYGLILRAALRAAGSRQRRKALHTCGTHLMVMMSFYLVGSVTFLSHTLRLGIPTDANTLLGLLYILLPATANPLIYGVRTASIRAGFLRMLRGGRGALLPAGKQVGAGAELRDKGQSVSPSVP